MQLNELSLFSGAGGGLLGTKLLGFNHIGYVEINEYCQKIISQRIEDGILDIAPIFTDVREFLQSGAAREYRGFADVVTAGFPCQPFSVAGKREGENDSRNMWPETISILREVRPAIALLENVPGLLAHKYGKRIFGDLAESGFDAKWRILSAAETGAPHKRDRLFIMAYDTKQFNGTHYKSNVSNANSGAIRTEQIRKQECKNKTEFRIDGKEKSMANTNNSRCKKQRKPKPNQKKHKTTKCRSWWTSEPRVGRVVDGLAYRVDRLKALGNGQVPSVVKAVWELLNND